MRKKNCQVSVAVKSIIVCANTLVVALNDNSKTFLISTNSSRLFQFLDAGGRVTLPSGELPPHPLAKTTVAVNNNIP